MPFTGIQNEEFKMSNLTAELMDCKTHRGFPAIRIVVQRGSEIIDMAESRELETLEGWLSVHYPDVKFPESIN